MTEHQKKSTFQHGDDCNEPNVAIGTMGHHIRAEDEVAINHLHRLIINQTHPEAIEYVNKYPGIATKPCGPDMMTPLHYVCVVGVDMHKGSNSKCSSHNLAQSCSELIETLVHAMGPHGILLPDKHGRTPLNIALHSKHQDLLVEALLKPYRHGEMRCPSFTRKERKTSLHVAISIGCSLATIQNIACTFPEYLSIGDYKSGNTPLHLAVSRIVDRFLSSMNDGIQQKFNALVEEDAKYPTLTQRHYGPLPLQRVQTSNASEILDVLLKLNPLAANIPNKNLQLPLHILCYIGPSSNAISPACMKAAIRLLVKAHPTGLVEKDNRGYTPIDYILLHEENAETYFMTKYCNEILRCCHGTVGEDGDFSNHESKEIIT
ncbi:hypothetical protein ACHAXS_006729 [Conticribra weissflogii]